MREDRKLFSWLIIASWVGLAVALSVFAPKLADVGTTDPEKFIPADAPASQAQHLLDRGWKDADLQKAAVLVLERRGGVTRADLDYLGTIESWMNANVPEVASVQSVRSDARLAAFLRSQDGKATLDVVSFNTAPFSTPTNKAVERIAAHLSSAPAPEGARVFLTGSAAIAADQAKGITDSFARTASISIVLVLLILLYVYRSPVAALIPVFTIGLAFAVARSVIALMAKSGFEVASQVETFMVVMVFGAGTDYVLFLLSRYREERAGGDQPLSRTLRLVRPVIIASGATVVLAFLSQLTARFGIYRSMGPAIGIAVAVTVAAALTLSPAVAVVCGRRAFWPRKPQDDGPASDARWARLAALVTRRPAVVLGAGVLLLAIPAGFVVGIRTTFNILQELPSSARSREGFAALSRHYPAGRLAPVFVVLQRKEGLGDDASFALMRRVNDRLRELPGVAEVRSAPLPIGRPITLDLMSQASSFGFDTRPGAIDPKTLDRIASLMSTRGGLVITPSLAKQVPALRPIFDFFLSPDRRLARIFVSLNTDPFSTKATADLDALRSAAATEARRSGMDVSVAVGGPTAFYGDMRRIGDEDFRVIMVQVIAIVLLVFALVLRSAVAPFYLLATVLLSFFASMGATVLVFQRIAGQDGVSLWVPPFLFIMLVALGADYNIFLMSRVKEEYERSGDPTIGVRRGVELTGRVITSAGLILAGTFAVLLLAPMPSLQQVGFAITFGILLDTFVVRTLLVPSATTLLGHRAWFPRRPAQADSGRATSRARRRPGERIGVDK